MSNHLLRSHAPITDAGWAELEREVQQQILPALAARRLVDFSGPKGWEHSATNTGRTAGIGAPSEGLKARQRRVLPLAELRADFTVTRDELRDFDRGAADLDLDALDSAARRMAEAENVAVFHGWADAGIAGIAEAVSAEPIPLGGNVTEYPRPVARAVEVLLSGGIVGPYGLALGPDTYTDVVETTEHGGIIVFDHLRQILGGPIVWAPGVRGAVVVSLRGGDFLFESGQDLSVGYDHHDGDSVSLYLEESFSFRVVTPQAGVVLSP
jgi:uncharacterized linocin/CFP29 family protein